MVNVWAAIKIPFLCFVLKVKKYKKDVTRDVSVGYQRCVGKRVNFKLLSVLYNSWFSNAAITLKIQSADRIFVFLSADKHRFEGRLKLLQDKPHRLP